MTQVSTINEVTKVIKAGENSFRVIAAAKQGPAGTPGSSGSQVELSRQNTDLDVTPIGSPVFLHAGGGIRKANAGIQGMQEVIGLASLEIGAGVFGVVRASGLLTASAEGWDAITGTVGGLSPNRFYFLDVVAGKMTLTPPSSTGQYSVRLGQAFNATDFLIKIEPSIKL